ncbi:hypothetical protein OROMI_004071 [Orobanche minor]
MTVLIIPSSLSFSLLLVTSTEIKTGVPSGYSFTDLTTRKPISEARDFENCEEIFANPNLSRVVQYSKCEMAAFLLYIIAPSQGHLSSSSTPISSCRNSTEELSEWTANWDLLLLLFWVFVKVKFDGVKVFLRIRFAGWFDLKGLQGLTLNWMADVAAIEQSISALKAVKGRQLADLTDWERL